MKGKQEQGDCGQSANWSHGNTGGNVICGSRHDSGHRMDRRDIRTHRLFLCACAYWECWEMNGRCSERRGIKK